MKSFMIYWQDGTMSITFAKNKEEAKFNFDVIGDVDGLEVDEINASGLVVDYRINDTVDVDTQLVTDKIFDKQVLKLYDVIEERANSSTHQENHSTTP